MSRVSDAVFSLVKLSPQYKSVQRLLAAIDVKQTLAAPQNHAPKGRQVVEQRDTPLYSVEIVIEDGIERITYTPKQARYQTPILMMHGMWHGAWCWQPWQEMFAEWGWRSISFSLPGHGNSPIQKRTQQITLDYYLAFLRDEIARLDRPPVLMGHSMGGALTQWYLRHVNDDLPAVVLVASWVHDDASLEGFERFLSLDPVGTLFHVPLSGDATPYIRTPYRAARLLVTDACIYTPEALHAKLKPESNLIMMQHNPPFWEPCADVRAPMLVLAGERDAVLSVNAVRRTADHYRAELVVVPDAGHNLMMDAHYRETAAQIKDWLQKQVKS